MLAAAQRGLATVKYQIDPSASRFTVQAFATGLLSSFGHNPTIAIRDFEGEVQSGPEDFENASLLFTVRTAKMEVLDEMKKDDRLKLEEEMYDKVLNVKQFPTATFTSKQITVQKLGNDLFQAHVAGELAFHGVQHDHSFDARIMRLGTMLRVSGEFSLRQSDYGIKPFKAAGGALRLKDEVKFSCELVARQQEEAKAGV
jgi:polyisoprenoid-binding protein YceI